MMMKKPIQKLLAVALAMGASTASAAPRTLANGAPAPGNTVAKGETYKQETPTQRARNELAAARNALSAAFAEEREATAAIVARPRTLANGAPACGNVNEKPMYSEDETGCTDAIADQYVTARIERLKRAGDLVERARTRLVAAEKVYAALVSPASTTTSGSRTASAPALTSVPRLAIAMEVVP